MDLLYVWIKEYKNIKEQGFSFSSEFKFDYNPVSKELTVSKNENYIAHFFKSEKELHGISNLTVVVGGNGSGKSNLLKLLLCGIVEKKCYAPGDPEDPENMDPQFAFFVNGFIVYSINGEKRILHSDDCRISLIPKDWGKVIWEDPSPDYYDADSKTFFQKQDIFNFSVIYYSSLFSGLPIEIPQNYGEQKTFDISTNAAIRKQRSVEKFITDEILNQIKFCINYYQHLEVKKDTFSFIPTIISLKTQNYGDFSQIEHPENVLEKREKKIILSFLTTLKLLTVKNGKIEKYKRFLVEKKKFDEIIDKDPVELIWECSELDGMEIELQVRPEDDLKKLKEDIDLIEEILGYLENKEKVLFSDIRAFLIKKLPLIGDLLKCLSDLEKQNAIKTTTSYHDIGLSIEQNSFDLIKKFIETYEGLCSYFTQLNLNEWLTLGWQELSTGEQFLLNLFSRFYDFFITEPNIKNDDSFLLLIDEGETAFHPQWQKGFVNSIVKLMPLIFPKKHLQIILTTHSPFVLSDLPKENVVFLKKNEKGHCVVVNRALADNRATFAANIHSLLADSFFLEGALIGDFAKEKINGVIRNLTDDQIIDENRLKEIRSIISYIGEPVIRHKLEQMYDKKRKFSVEDKMNEINLQIEKLKKDILNLENKKK